MIFKNILKTLSYIYYLQCFCHYDVGDAMNVLFDRFSENTCLKSSLDKTK